MRFALICPPYASHRAAFEALAAALMARGHSVAFLVHGGMAGELRLDGAQLAALPGTPDGLARIRANAALAGNPLFLWNVLKDGACQTRTLAQAGPELLRSVRADAIVADQMEPAGGLIARALSLPFVSLACSLPIETEAAVPPPFLNWSFDPSERGLRRNRGGNRVAHLLLTPQRRAIRDAAARLGLTGYDTLEDCLSPAGTVSQTVAAFDFPRQTGERIHGVGPIRRDRHVALFRPRDAGRPPLVYASLGTMQGHRLDIFRNVATACRRLGLRLAVAHCGGLSERQAASLDAARVCDFVDQPAMLRQASICVTHGGMNTALDALEAGVPMLALPLAFDQPGVAARIRHHGVGLSLSPSRASPSRASASRIEAALARILAEPGFAANACGIGQALKAGGGAARAAELVEDLCSGRAVPMDLAV
ncbi:nucleotide disphospho-sugar-binding domain-containing protein [Aureimonas frigidaquae]|uniref:nucleotide disphospho-sugar-binding domain-containing protein n=1 Tax=Aureimonas frigidaquae TaxID=424757 RepID=UPI0007810504|nr:glycosyltransferase [Aureimonas frigidaquae]